MTKVSIISSNCYVLRRIVSWGSPVVLSLWQKLETMTQQPDRLTADQTMQLHSSPQATKSTETIISSPWPHGHTTLVNKRLNKSGHWSSSFCNRCVHFFDRLLIPDHTATPMTCTEHQDYPDLLGSLSPRTFRQPCLQLSTSTDFQHR